MREQTIQLTKNLPPVLQRLTVEELYHIARMLGNECGRRDLDVVPEARAFELALLVPARAEHQLTLGAESEYDSAGVVNALRELKGHDMF